MSKERVTTETVWQAQIIYTLQNEYGKIPIIDSTHGNLK